MPADLTVASLHQIRINVASSGQARFVMRQQGNYRLLLNANLWPGINVAAMDGGRGVSFAVVNCAQQSPDDGEGKEPEPKLSTYAVRFKARLLLAYYCSFTSLTPHCRNFQGQEHVAMFTDAVDRFKSREKESDTPAAAENGGDEAV